MTMEYEKGDIEDNPSEFEKCLIFVKRNFPEDDERLQFYRAEAVYAMSKVIFNQVIPSVLHEAMQPSDN